MDGQCPKNCLLEIFEDFIKTYDEDSNKGFLEVDVE